MTALEALILGIIQGLTEFLPVSSSAHLVMGEELLGANEPGIAPRIDERVFDVLSVDASVRSRLSYGGTAPERVREQIAAAKGELERSTPA